jgi:hypothetical protein
MLPNNDYKEPLRILYSYSNCKSCVPGNLFTKLTNCNNLSLSKSLEQPPLECCAN